MRKFPSPGPLRVLAVAALTMLAIGFDPCLSQERGAHGPLAVATAEFK